MAPFWKTPPPSAACQKNLKKQFVLWNEVGCFSVFLFFLMHILVVCKRDLNCRLLFCISAQKFELTFCALAVKQNQLPSVKGSVNYLKHYYLKLLLVNLSFPLFPFKCGFLKNITSLHILCYTAVIEHVQVAVVGHQRAGRTIQLFSKNAIPCFQISFPYINKKEYNGWVIVWFSDNWHIAWRRLNFTL